MQHKHTSSASAVVTRRFAEAVGERSGDFWLCLVTGVPALLRAAALPSLLVGLLERCGGSGLLLLLAAVCHIADAAAAVCNALRGLLGSAMSSKLLLP